MDGFMIYEFSRFDYEVDGYDYAYDYVSTFVYDFGIL